MTKLQNNIDEIKSVLGLATTSVDAAEEKGIGDTTNTGNTGHGQELVQHTAFSAQILEEVRKASNFLSLLPGYHGSNLPQDLKVRVIGDAEYFENEGEWTNPANTGLGASNIGSAEITLSRKKLQRTIPVSDEMIAAGVDITEHVKNILAASWGKTVESILLNADNTTGTDNINAKGETIANTEKRHWFRQAGLRKTALAHATTYNIDALDENDLFDLVGMLGDKAANPADCIFVTNRRTALKIAQLPALKNQYQNGRSSTIVKGAETNLIGSDVVISAELKNTDNTGSVSKTASENTKGQILYMNKFAPQFGFTPVAFEVARVPGKGYNIIATSYFAHAIADKLLGADPSVALSINVAL